MKRSITISESSLKPYIIIASRNWSNSTNRAIKVVYISVIILGLFLTYSCNKLVDVPSPITSTNADIVYKNDASAIATLNNIYTIMSQSGIYGGITSLSLFPGLSADELSLFSNVSDQELLSYYTNSLRATDLGASDYWKSIYSKQIFLSNSAIEGLNKSSGLSPSVKKILLGEAYFIRAFCYFYLVNLYGDVPLVLTADYRVNSKIARTKKESVYEQIITDLKLAKDNLSNNYLDGSLLAESTERIAPTKWAAIAMLARVYLYTNDWNNAEAESSNIINQKELFDTVNIQSAFLINNKEAIWQLQSVSKFITNTTDALEFLQAKTAPGFARVHLTSDFIQSFENGDLRRAQWIDSAEISGVQYYLPAKYKINKFLAPVQERTTILRLAEQYLIRSEARTKIGNIDGALTDLNTIRTRAGLNKFSTSSKEQLLEQILKERRLELFTEWGHRWFDIKRTGIIDKVLTENKGNNWQNTDALYPIPLTEIQQNQALSGHQNPGY